jgi:CRP-like cAMP-binding protein
MEYGVGGNVIREAWGSVSCGTAGRKYRLGEYLGQKLAKSLRPGLNKSRAVVSNADLGAFGKLVKVRAGIRRGETIASNLHSGKHFTVLVEGSACMTTRHVDGARQIYIFHYPGDFLALHGFLHPESAEHIEVEALSTCSIGTIDRESLEQTMQSHPALGQALWRAAMIEASIFRQRLVMARWPALQRVAHLLCEQLFRVGPNNLVIPLSQIDVADTVGLSVVHTNRIFQDLRKLGVLSEKRRIEVVNNERLQKLAAFDGRYLDPNESLSRWELRIEN